MILVQVIHVKIMAYANPKEAVLYANVFNGIVDHVVNYVSK
jgi:hypothetical protein